MQCNNLNGFGDIGGIAVGSRSAFEAMNRAIALYGLRPVIDRVLPEAPLAYRHFAAMQHTGKLVIGGAQ